jgi:hypothetical protein
VQRSQVVAGLSVDCDRFDEIMGVLHGASFENPETESVTCIEVFLERIKVFLNKTEVF